MLSVKRKALDAFIFSYVSDFSRHQSLNISFGKAEHYFAVNSRYLPNAVFNVYSVLWSNQVIRPSVLLFLVEYKIAQSVLLFTS